MQGTEAALRSLDQVLDIAIDACIVRRILETSTLPILLLEDALDVLPLSTCEAAWGVFESHKDALVDTLNAIQVRSGGGGSGGGHMVTTPRSPCSGGATPCCDARRPS